jgi:hemoglobin
LARGYERRLGRADAFQVAVEDFYRRVLRDARLRPYFEGVDVDRLKRHQHALLAMAVGGVHGYLGRTMAAAHARLDITDEAFDRVMDHLVGTLEDLGMPPESIREIGGNLLPMRHDICERAAPEVAASNGRH